MTGRRIPPLGWAFVVLVALTLSACTPRPTLQPGGATAPAPQATYPTTDHNLPDDAEVEGPDDVAQPDRAVFYQGMIVLPLVDPAEITGDLTGAGSTALAPLTERLAERFQEEGFSGQITLDIQDTASGLERFCTGEADFALASRPIESAEAERCTQNGRTPLEFPVTLDAVVVIISDANTFADQLSLKEAVMAFSTAVTWRDVRSDWPADPIQRFTPPPTSATWAFFAQHLFPNNEAVLRNASQLTPVTDPHTLIQRVAASPSAVGFLSYAQVQNDQDQILVLPLAGIDPWTPTVVSGQYPLSRTLYLYTDPGVMHLKPQVAAFVNYYLTYVNEEAEDVGNFPLDQDTLNQGKATWLQTMGLDIPRP